MLKAARDFVERQRVTSVRDLAIHLGTTASVADALLRKWEAKGQIERLTIADDCAQCALCSRSARELVRWAGADTGRESPQRVAGRNTSLPSSCPSAGPPQGS